MSVVPFLLAGGRADWVPREPILGCIREERPPMGGPRARNRSHADCPECFAQFERQNPTQRYCSWRCSAAARSSKR